MTAQQTQTWLRTLSHYYTTCFQNCPQISCNQFNCKRQVTCSGEEFLCWCSASYAPSPKISNGSGRTHCVLLRLRYSFVHPCLRWQKYVALSSDVLDLVEVDFLTAFVLALNSSYNVIIGWLCRISGDRGNKHSHHPEDRKVWVAVIQQTFSENPSEIVLLHIRVDRHKSQRLYIKQLGCAIERVMLDELRSMNDWRRSGACLKCDALYMLLVDLLALGETTDPAVVRSDIRAQNIWLVGSETGTKAQTSRMGLLIPGSRR